MVYFIFAPIKVQAAATTQAPAATTEEENTDDIDDEDEDDTEANLGECNVIFTLSQIGFGFVFPDKKSPFTPKIDGLRQI